MRIDPGELRLPTPAELNRAHDRTLEQFGGSQGFKDQGLVDSAIEATRMQHQYQPEARLMELAVGLAFRLIKNHAYTDGNKRTAALAMELTLFHNGYYLDLPPGMMEQWMRMLEASTSASTASVQSGVATVAETLLQRRTVSPSGIDLPTDTRAVVVITSYGRRVVKTVRRVSVVSRRFWRFWG